MIPTACRLDANIGAGVSTHNITLWTFHDGIRKMIKRGPGREPWHLARDQ